MEDQFVPYLKPQEYGNHVGVRWFTVTNEKNEGFIISGKSELEISATAYTAEELEAAPYAYQLPKSEKTLVRVNLAQTGIGGDDSWGQETHPEFRLPGTHPYNYSFIIDKIN